MTRRLRALLPVLFFAPALGAQVVDSARLTMAVKAPKSVISLNPFAVMLPILTGDFEQVVTPSFTLGFGGTISGNSEWNHYRALDVKARLYPGESAPSGFSIAGTFGVASASDNSTYTIVYPGATVTYDNARATKATFGTDLSYQWLLGPKKTFVIVLGAGVKRFLGGGSSVFPIESDVMPTARINIGVAF